jgi:hypothetical protein
MRVWSIQFSLDSSWLNRYNLFIFILYRQELDLYEKWSSHRKSDSVFYSVVYLCKKKCHCLMCACFFHFLLVWTSVRTHLSNWVSYRFSFYHLFTWLHITKKQEDRHRFRIFMRKSLQTTVVVLSHEIDKIIKVLNKILRLSMP